MAPRRNGLVRGRVDTISFCIGSQSGQELCQSGHLGAGHTGLLWRERAPRHWKHPSTDHSAISTPEGAAPDPHVPSSGAWRRPSRGWSGAWSGSWTTAESSPRWTACGPPPATSPTALWAGSPPAHGSGDPATAVSTCPSRTSWSPMPRNQVPHLALRRSPGQDGGRCGRPAACSVPLCAPLPQGRAFRSPCVWWTGTAGRMGFSSGLLPAVERVGPFHFHDTVDGQLQGSVELAAPGQGTLAGGAAVSGSSSASMNVCTLRVAPNTWVALLKER